MSSRVATSLVIGLSLLLLGQAAPPRSKNVKLPEWKEIEALASDQKLEAASRGAEARLEAARGTADEAEWTRALIQVVQLRMGLHGYETAVRFLKTEKWPQGAAHRTALNLFYASSLVHYARAYSWEIRQRERVESSQPVDLKAWTMEQLYAEASRAYLDIWKSRAALGTQEVKALSDYLTANNYPPQIRGTLRDAVSYLWLELLQDTAGWTPEQSATVYQLELGKLLAASSERAKSTKLDDAATHPLVRLAAVLDDLEGWHLSEGRKESALEARLARYRALQQSFAGEDDAALLRKRLAADLEAFRDVPWYAMGKAQQAQLVQASGDLVAAREVALEGKKAYPKSPGGARCAQLVQAIEAPDFQLSSMLSDGAGKRSLEVKSKNLAKVYFRAYPVELEKWIAQAKDYNLLPEGREMQAFLASRKPVQAWTSALPATPDYQLHKSYVSPPLSAPGLYVVIGSAREDFSLDNNRLLGVNLVVGDLVTLVRSDAAGGHEVSVLSGSTGKAVPGAEVRLYRFDYQKGHRLVETRQADERGVVDFAATGALRNQSYFLVAKKGSELSLHAQGIYFSTPSSERDGRSVLVYTDRSVYRPQQKLYWKAVVYTGSARDARYQTLANTEVSVSLVDPNSQVVETKKLTTNSFGTAAGEFTIPTGRPLGGWSINAGYPGGATVRVEEYKRPTFEVSFREAQAPMRLNKPATLVGEAKFYFGLPVTSGKVRWKVVRSSLYPWWWDFGFWGGHGGRAAPHVVASGTSTLGKDGTFPVAFTPEADERGGKSKDVTYRYEVTADVTDEGGETRSATKAVRLGQAAVEAQVRLDDALLVEGEPMKVTLLRTSLDGAPRPGKGQWRLFELVQPKAPVMPADEVQGASDESGPSGPKRLVTEGDKLRPRWETGYAPERTLRRWKNGAVRGNGDVTHDAKGEAGLSLPALKAGAYRLTYETVDEYGTRVETSKELVVAGPQLSLALPAVLTVQRSQVRVGEKARLLVHSGLSQQPMVLDLYRSGKRVDRKYLTAGEASSLVELPVTDADRGGFAVTLTAVRDFQVMSFTSHIFVPWDDKELKLELATFRDKFQPGSKETWRVTVKGKPDKQPEAAAVELLAYMYDQSLDLFAPHTPPSIVGLYPYRAQGVSLRDNLQESGASWLARTDLVRLAELADFHGDQLKLYPRYGIGGPGARGVGFGGGGLGMEGRMAMRAMAPAESLPEGKADAISTNELKRERSEADKAQANKPASAPPPPAGGPAQGSGQPPPLRSNFAETAFWKPQLLVGPDGSATLEFTAPDSVTAWNVWIHGVTRDLRGGSVSAKARSVKELMVRPYAPRFLREGDKAKVKVVVNNASERKLDGTVRFEIIDPETQQDVSSEFGLTGPASAPFSAEAGKSATATFALVAPKRVGQVAFRVTGTAGSFSDGELRPLPLLPSRMHLAQSRFAALKDNEARTLVFEDLAKGGDPTRLNEQLVVTVDAQLFQGVLQSIPYLLDYPYECTEQTLNRFLSTGIVSSVYQRYPSVAKMAAELSARTTPLETFDQVDPNRKMALEETPWLLEAKGGVKPGEERALVNVLDAKAAAAERNASLAKLQKAQTSLGGFPWWPGGPPSPYMTLYLAHGFAKAAEFKVDVPKEMVQRAWQYLARHYREEYAGRMVKDDCCWEFLTFLNYVASSYPDESWTGSALTLDERKTILAHSFKHWKEHSPYLKGYLALTLKRMGRPADAKKVFDSVMDSAKTTRDDGTYWAPEDRGWLWYNDRIETHAFALRVLMELSPKDERRAGLVQWLFMNKKLNHWKSTRATAEVVYSLVKYLEAEQALGVRETTTVAVGPRQTRFEFEPDRYTGKKNQVVVPGSALDEKAMSTVTVSKEGKGFQFASATWHYSTDKLPEEARGDLFHVTRSYFRRETAGKETVLKPLADGAKLEVGDELEVQLSIRARHAAEYVHLRDPRGAGFEPESPVSRYRWNLGLGWYEEPRDSGINFYFEALPAGEYTLKYRVRANMEGTFRVGPATLQSMYAPEFTAFSAGNELNVGAAKK